MSRYSAVIMLAVLSTGCMHEAKKPQTQPPPVAATPETAKAPQTAKATPATAKPPSTTSKAPATTTKAKPAPATTAKTAPSSAAKPQAAPPKQAAAATAPKRPAAAPTLDLAGLEARLKQTKAIGLMTKLSLKNKVDDLLDEFRNHYAGKPMPTMAQLRSTYDLLMMKVLSLLQDKDQQLASDILSSRERIWGLLADPKAFAALQAE